MRELRASPSPHAKEAIDLYVNHIVRACGSLAAVLQGLDILVFTGGIGVNDGGIRAAITRQLAWLGRIEVRVIATNEEAMIAQHTVETLD